MDKAVACDEALQWLCRGDQAAEHQRVKSSRVSGTLQWLVNSPQFRRWLGDEHQVLLLTGFPGAGKTTATSMVVDTLLERHGSDDSVGIAFFYSRYDNPSNNPELIIQSFLYQLVSRLPVVPPALANLYRRFEDHTSPPPLQELLRTISTVIASMKKVYLVVDALDELSSSHRRTLLPELFGLQNTLQVCLFATSRSVPEIESRFTPFPSLNIGHEVGRTSAEDNLNEYLDQRMALMPGFIRNSSEVQAQVRAKVREASFGS